jgi:hypothetical protein
MSLSLDHLAVSATTLEEGAAWVEKALGVPLAGGGKHPHMGTHNRLLSLACEAFPRAYFEIIAIDPEAPPPGRARWFGLDEPALQAALKTAPQLVQWVARTPELDTALAALARCGVDAGKALQASRVTPQGTLRWRFSARDDGRPLFDGALPMLIEWGGAHPADTMPPSGVTLGAFSLGAADPEPLRQALQVLGARAPAPASPALQVVLDTPRGRVVLSSTLNRET